jgi:putative transposase
MKIQKAFKFRLNTKRKDTSKLFQFAGCCRFVWNKCLASNKLAVKNKQKIAYYQETSFWLTLWKQSEEYKFLKDCHSQPLQQSLKSLGRAFKDCFDKKQPLKKFPRFKNKYKSSSFTFPQGFKINNNQVYLPKLGWFSFRKHRSIQGNPKNVTISYKSGHWYISIQTEQTVATPIHQSKTMVGIDVGIANFATLSTGEVIKPLNQFRKLETKLAREQRTLARRKKLSNGWKNQKTKIQRLHAFIANSKSDFLHKASTNISKNHAMIVLEDLKVRNLSKSAKGTADNHGKNVKAKSGLNKSILDQGWGMFRQMLEYKQRWSGGDVLAINPRNTSRTCLSCSHVSKDNRTTQAKFECVSCGYSANADYVGACNILRVGHTQLAC